MLSVIQWQMWNLLLILVYGLFYKLNGVLIILRCFNNVRALSFPRKPIKIGVHRPSNH